jgi:hypothetical protein
MTPTSVVATSSEPRGTRCRRILKRRCASIPQNSGEYDGDLVSLRRTWKGAGARAADDSGSDGRKSGMLADVGAGSTAGDASGNASTAGLGIAAGDTEERLKEGGKLRLLFKRRCAFIIQHPEYSRELVHLCALSRRR